ncbi:MAG: hypothetical protein SFW09_08610 [Hyphomicrobiaceae bacterium]|nr:hypothetical protein [Hyphomicrobiaceae bacterium]
MSLKVLVAAIALAGASVLGSAAIAAPIAPASGPGVDARDLPVEAVQYYHNKRQHCWHWDGWKGPGWYWCGYHKRRGYGWGGGAGWNKWSHPPRHNYAPRHYRRAH